MITLLNKFDDDYLMREKDFLDISASYIKDNDLENYLNDVIFDPSYPHIGRYDILNRRIILNNEKIIELANRLYRRLQDRYPIDERYSSYFINFYYLYILYHELAHVDEKVKYDSVINSSPIFNYLYEMCLKITSKDGFYRMNHDLIPMEIDANNYGYLKAWTLMSYTKLPRREQRIMHLEYLSSMLHNYQKVGKNKIITPIVKLSMMDREIDLDKIIEYTNESRLSKIDRINLGLSITPDEYDSINMLE